MVVRGEDGIGKLRDEAAAMRLWVAAEGLTLRGIPHATALAFFPGENRRWWVLSREERGRPLADLAEVPAAEQRRVVADLARSLGRLHATGWRCRDSRGDNLFFAAGRASILDLDGVRPFALLRAGAVRAADLGRLLAWARFQAPRSLRDVLPSLLRSFLVSYLQTLRALGSQPSAGSLARAAWLRSERWRQRHQSRI
jgi:hypothetical protein